MLDGTRVDGSENDVRLERLRQQVSPGTEVMEQGRSAQDVDGASEHLNKHTCTIHRWSGMITLEGAGSLSCMSVNLTLE